MANFEEAYKYVMSQPPIHFAGRLRELAMLKSTLIASTHRSALIFGQAGIGKSALVAEFIAQTSEFFVGGIRRLPPFFVGGVHHSQQHSIDPTNE